jgi:hypothetical protein
VGCGNGVREEVVAVEVEFKAVDEVGYDDVLQGRGRGSGVLWAWV